MSKRKRAGSGGTEGQKATEKTTEKTTEKERLAGFINARLNVESAIPLSEQLSRLVPEILSRRMITLSLYNSTEDTHVKEADSRGHRKPGGYTPELLYTCEHKGQHVSLFIFDWKVGAVTSIHSHPLVKDPSHKGRVFKCGVVVAQGKIKETTYDNAGHELSKVMLNEGAVTQDIFHSKSSSRRRSNYFHRLRVPKEAASAKTVHVYPLAPDAARCATFVQKAASKLHANPALGH